MPETDRFSATSVALGETIQAQEKRAPRVPPVKVTQGHWNRRTGIDQISIWLPI